MSAAPAAGPAAQKKRLIAQERDEEARAAWRSAVADLDPATLVFLDETSTNVAFTRLRARAPRGVPAVGTVPRNHGPNLTLLAGLTPEGITAPLVIDGAVDGDLFAAYVTHWLVPTLRSGQVVILDNLAVHKNARARKVIEAAGCRLIFLPTYSPDYNPIELAYAKLKGHLRRAGARTREPLIAAIGTGLAAITSTDAHGFFAPCGFPLPGS